MKVYVITYGERMEGSSVQSIHATPELARDAVQRLIQKEGKLDCGKRWKQIVMFKSQGKEKGILEIWEQERCDYIMIKEWKVQS